MAVFRDIFGVVNYRGHKGRAASRVTEENHCSLLAEGLNQPNFE